MPARKASVHCDLEGEVLIVVVFYSGIGLESSLLFAQEGANVLLVDVNLAAAEKVQKVISERFPNVQSAAIKADVGKEDEVKGAVDKAVELFGRLDVMVSILFSLFSSSKDITLKRGFAILVQQCRYDLVSTYLITRYRTVCRYHAPCRR